MDDVGPSVGGPRVFIVAPSSVRSWESVRSSESVRSWGRRKRHGSRGLDALGEDMATGATRLSDMKASSTAPFTPNQTVVYPELELYGGVVVGRGKVPCVGGTNIPPTAVDVMRKVDDEPG